MNHDFFLVSFRSFLRFGCLFEMVFGLRGILASEILNAQRRNKGNESVYADLVSEINVHCPCVTKLIIVRLVLRLKNCLANKRKVAGLSTAVFIGQLIKSSVVSTFSCAFFFFFFL